MFSVQPTQSSQRYLKISVMKCQGSCIKNDNILCKSFYLWASDVMWHTCTLSFDRIFLYFWMKTNKDNHAHVIYRAAYLHFSVGWFLGYAAVSLENIRVTTAVRNSGTLWWSQRCTFIKNTFVTAQ